MPSIGMRCRIESVKVVHSLMHDEIPRYATPRNTSTYDRREKVKLELNPGLVGGIPIPHPYHHDTSKWHSQIPHPYHHDTSKWHSQHS